MTVTDTPLLEVSGVTKSFGAVKALKGVSLQVSAGEILALLGANGAGKSTLVRVLAGIVRPDAGTIHIAGERVVIAGPQDASHLRLAFLHQELNLVPRFTAAENMALGLLRRGHLGLAATGEARRRAEAVAAELEISFPLSRVTAELSIADQWLVAVGRALMRKARIIFLDEPTAALSARETKTFLAIVRRLAADGIAIVYVSHRLREVEELCDRATVFRDGRVVSMLERKDMTHDKLISAITGGLPGALSVASIQDRAPGAVVLEARRLSRADRVRDVSFVIRAGEVVGLAGLVGAGRTELARLIFGADRLDSGEILLDGVPVSLSSPADASRRGIALVPEERRTEGLVMEKSVAFNINLTAASASSSSPWLPGWVSPRNRRERANIVAEKVDLQPRDVTLPVRAFSGGNQQKIVLGRWILNDLRVLILDEPTRGIDVAARAQIHRLIRTLAERGLAILVISSDFEELLGCNRVMIMAGGQIVSELTGAAITEEGMLRGAHQIPIPTIVGST